ncbi:MAG: hypothetical protein MUC71_01815 [Steroidobacteraceae bacterium]|jgi:opacity protein-like surface antigen|nr:hypothetical protein [Steroidobacteraceae bacterium]
MKHLIRACLVAAAILTGATAQADEWQHEFAPYLWATGMDGTAGVGPVEASVDVGFSDILDNLEMAFLGTYRASKGPLSLTMDVVYMGLGETVRGPGGLVTADIDMDQTALEGTAGWALTEQFVLFGGLRYVDLSVDVQARTPQGDLGAASGSESWVDPIVGARYTIPFNDQWSLALRGDIGGFGIGSDFAWQAAAAVRWQASPRVGVLAAYRYVDMDYEDGSGAGFFKYDMSISGPALGVVFTF